MTLEKTYGRVDSKGLWEVMMIYGVGGRLLDAEKLFYISSRACMRVKRDESECFNMGIGVRQGSVISPWLFSVYMNGLVKDERQDIW